MTERYSIAKDSILEVYLVTPDVYEGILERFEKFVTPYVEHLHKRVQRQKPVDDMKGLMSETERKNVELIALFCRRRTRMIGSARIGLQFFIGQVEWDDEIILDKLAKRVAREIGTTKLRCGSFAKRTGNRFCIMPGVIPVTVTPRI